MFCHITQNWRGRPLTSRLAKLQRRCPPGSLIADNSGALYGTTAGGGSSNNGTVFRLTPPAKGQTAWTETVLYRFTGGSDGTAPNAGLPQRQSPCAPGRRGESGLLDFAGFDNERRFELFFAWRLCRFRRDARPSALI